jgi:excisionase family DNA binding protein
VQIHIDGLEDLLRRVVREEITRDRDGWLDAAAAAEYLSVTRATLHNAVSAGRLPRHGSKGTALRFRRSELDDYAEGRPGLDSRRTTSKCPGTGSGRRSQHPEVDHAS